MSSEQHLLNRIKNRYLVLRGVETVVLAVGVSFFSFSVVYYFSVSASLPWVIASIVAFTVLCLRIISLGLYQLSESRITTYLNHHYPQLEASADLLLAANEGLSMLQLFQKSQVYRKLTLIEKEIHFPHRIALASMILFVGIGSWFVADYFKPSTSPYSAQKNESSPISLLNEEKKSVVTLTKISVSVNPPSYTQRASSTSSQLPLKVIEGSLVKWEFQFNGSPINLILIFSGKDTIQLKSQKETFTFQRNFNEGGFYQFTWVDQEKNVHQSDYYPIEIIKDEVPRIVVENLAQFVELKVTDRLMVDLQASLSDDFGLKDAHIIATVSKGSGESVKFREETLRFTTPASFSGKIQRATRAIDLIKLGLEPGDELYFYIEAFDNKIPIANKARTETFFIAIQDTTSYEVAVDAGMGVDVLPEYFRSQRQIIIDSEKILEERKEKKIIKEAFNAKSNELGYDQKVLRLRYGQFMGDEEEGTEVEAEHDHDEEHDGEQETAEEIMQKLGHQHDTENENNLVVEKPIDAKVSPQDEASLFQQSIKTKLKTAIALMWDAELQLRMYQPDKSLPYQYKILKLLKEISNDSRVYVHRSGFDPPPLKEEKRLSGDLSEVKNSFNQNSNLKEEFFPDIRHALILIESLLQKDKPLLNASSQTVLQKAGNELAGAAIKQPGAYLKSLSLLKLLLANELDESEIKPALKDIQKSLWKIVPPEVPSPSAKSNTMHPLDVQFLQQLETLKHER